MGASTITLTASGRMPGNLSATPTTSTYLLINSSQIGLWPHKTSGFSVYKISCMGTGSTIGKLGIPNGETNNGTVSISTGGRLLFCSVDYIERVSGSTVTLKGGAAF